MARTVVRLSVTGGANLSFTVIVNRVDSGEPGVTRPPVVGLNTKARKACDAAAAVTPALVVPNR